MINATVCQGRNCEILRESAGEVTKAGDFCLQLRWETGQAGEKRNGARNAIRHHARES